MIVVRNLLIIIMGVSWIVKVIIHFHLDWKTERMKGLPPADMIPIHYFFPYVQPLEKKYLREEKICNIFYWVATGSSISLLFWYYLFPCWR